MVRRIIGRRIKDVAWIFIYNPAQALLFFLIFSLFFGGKR